MSERIQEEISLRKKSKKEQEEQCNYDYATLKILQKQITQKNVENGEVFQEDFSEDIAKVLKRTAQEKKERVEIQKCMIQLLENMEVEVKEHQEKERHERQLSQDHILNILDRIFSHIEKQGGFNNNYRSELQQSILDIKQQINKGQKKEFNSVESSIQSIRRIISDTNNDIGSRHQSSQVSPISRRIYHGSAKSSQDFDFLRIRQN